MNTGEDVLEPFPFPFFPPPSKSICCLESDRNFELWSKTITVLFTGGVDVSLAIAEKSQKLLEERVTCCKLYPPCLKAWLQKPVIPREHYGFDTVTPVTAMIYGHKRLLKLRLRAGTIQGCCGFKYFLVNLA